MKTYAACLMFVVTGMLYGCVSGGVKVEERQLASFQKGQTTYAQVIAQLGAPTSSSLMSDGRRMIM